MGSLPDCVRATLHLHSPRLRFINRLPINVQPPPKGQESFLEDGSNHPFFCRPHIEKVVASKTHSLHQLLRQINQGNKLCYLQF